MPPKPTCKVVKREGEGGARIHPLGCQVRTDVKGDGTKITTNKAGQRKYKKKETSKAHIIFAAKSPTEPRENWVKMIYDTGASLTYMSKQHAAKLGYDAQTVRLSGVPGSYGGVGGRVQGRELIMSFYLRMRPNDWRWVSGATAVVERARVGALLGTPHMKTLVTAYQVKFV